MASIIFCKALSLENMTKVSPAISASYFCSLAIFIRLSYDGPLNFLIKAWPTAARVKFAVGVIKFGVTSTTVVCTLLKVLVVFICERWFCSFANNYFFFLGCKLAIWCFIHRFSFQVFLLEILLQPNPSNFPLVYRLS